MFGAEGSALKPSITRLMRRRAAIVLLLRGNERDLDFMVWALRFPLLGWHLLSLFPLSSRPAGTNTVLFSPHSASSPTRARPPLLFGTSS